MHIYDIDDIDNDGDVDIFLSYNQGGMKVVFYENDGTNTFSESMMFSFEDAGFIEDIIIEDINRDNLKDIVSLGSVACVSLINKGNLDFEQITLFNYDYTIQLGSYRTLMIGDYNGDGNKDIIAGDKIEDSYWYKNVSNNPPSYERHFLGKVEPIRYMDNADLDNDGDMDILVSDGELWWYENKIDQVTSTVDISSTPISIFPNPFQDVIQLEDLDNFQDYRFEVSTIDGKIVFSSIIKSNTIDLSSLSSGFYNLSLINRFTNEIKTTKIVKE